MTTCQPRVRRVSRLGWSLVGRVVLAVAVGVVTGGVLQRRSEELEHPEGILSGSGPSKL